jgi:uncharacterized protein YpmB
LFTDSFSRGFSANGVALTLEETKRQKKAKGIKFGLEKKGKFFMVNSLN